MPSEARHLWNQLSLGSEWGPSLGPGVSEALVVRYQFARKFVSAGTSRDSSLRSEWS